MLPFTKSHKVTYRNAGKLQKKLLKLTLTKCLEIYFNRVLKNLRGNEKLPVTIQQVAFR